MVGTKKEIWRLVLIVSMFWVYTPINADIIVSINLDTTKWAPVAYLSIISDFSQINTISYSNIIERSSISEDGVFKFQTNLLPDEDRLYRIHISKNGDPPASLIIGGSSHNHFFLFAKKDIEIQVNSRSVSSLFQELNMEGYNLNTSLLDINIMKNQLDTFDYYGSSVNIDYVRNAIYNEMRHYADTCSLPLASLYAIYQSNYKSDFQVQPDYYANYLDKYESEESQYFDSFRNQLSFESKTNWISLSLVVLIFFTIILSSVLYFIRNKNTGKNALSILTLQERRIYALLKEGKANKEIANEIIISVSTVKTHVNNIYAKLGVSSRKEILDYNNDKT